MAITGALLQQRGNGQLDPEITSLNRAFARLNVPVSLFIDKRLIRGQVALSRNTMVAGHIPVVLAALRQLGCDLPMPIDYPEPLRPWLRRRVWTSNVREVVHLLDEQSSPPFFVKPIGRHKRFRGCVVQSWSDLHALAGASNNTEVFCSDVVKW